jgi:hypothetical protein
MNSREKYAALFDNPSFETVVDQACERLWDRKIQYSIRRIREMEEQLTELERELETLALLRNREKL